MGKEQNNPSKKEKMRQKKQEKEAQQSKSKPKAQIEAKESSDESEDADIDFNQLQKQETENLEVGFIIGEIQETYYHSLKTILLRYAEITKTTNSEVADAIIENKTIGNVILADDYDQQQEDEQEEEEQEEPEDDEENVYSVLSVFPGKSKLGKRVRSFVLKTIEKRDFPEEVTSLLKDTKTSVILNERLPNLPAFVVNSAHEVFKKDMEELKSKDPKKYEEIYSGYLLSISQIQFEGEQELQKLIYSKFQDFQMCKRSLVWWIGEKNNSLKKKADMRNLYYLILAEEYFQGIDQIKTYLEE